MAPCTRVKVVFQRFTRALDSGMQSTFEKIGTLDARHPWKVIGASLLFILLCCSFLGLFFHYEQEREKLWRFVLCVNVSICQVCFH